MKLSKTMESWPFSQTVQTLKSNLGMKSSSLLLHMSNTRSKTRIEQPARHKTTLEEAKDKSSLHRTRIGKSRRVSKAITTMTWSRRHNKWPDKLSTTLRVDQWQGTRINRSQQSSRAVSSIMKSSMMLVSKKRCWSQVMTSWSNMLTDSWINWKLWVKRACSKNNGRKRLKSSSHTTFGIRRTGSKLKALWLAWSSGWKEDFTRCKSAEEDW